MDGGFGGNLDDVFNRVQQTLKHAAPQWAAFTNELRSKYLEVHVGPVAGGALQRSGCSEKWWERIVKSSLSDSPS